MARILAPAVLFLISAATSVSNAHVSAVSAGTASAGRAAIESYDIPFLNPAGIAYSRGYNFSTGFSRLQVPKGIDQEEWAVLLSDNMDDTVVPTAFAYVQKKDLNPASTWSQRDMRLSVGNIFYGDHALGFGLVYRDDKTPAKSSQQLSMTLGGLFSLTKELGFAVVLENIAPLMASDTAREKLKPLTALGLSYNASRHNRIRLDLTSASDNSFGRPTVAGGVENYLNQWMIFRIGAARNMELEQTTYSAGLGFAGPRFGIHYAFQNVATNLGQDHRHSIDLGMPIW